MTASALFGERFERTLPPMGGIGDDDALAGMPDICSGLFGEPRDPDVTRMRAYYRLLAIRAQARRGRC